MATLAQSEQAASDLDALTTLLAAEFASQVATIPDLAPDEVAGLMRDLADELVDEYGRVASLLMAEWYEDLRPDRGFDAIVVSPDRDRLHQNLSWSLNDLIGEEPDRAAAASKTAGVADLAVTDAARGTVITNLRRDPLDVRYARHASANACAFCAMLTTRQAAYRSDDDAGFAAHRSCHCIAVPVWPGQEVEEAPYVDQWRETYYAARKATGGDTKAVLAEMRRIGGLR